MAISSLTIAILAPRSATADLESALSFYDSLTCKSCSKPLPWFAWQGEIVVRMQGFWYNAFSTGPYTLTLVQNPGTDAQQSSEMKAVGLRLETV